MAAHYEGQLQRSARDTYGAMRKGFAAVDKGVSVPTVDIREASEVYTRLRLDHPELFYLTGFHLRMMPGAEKSEAVADYLFDKSKILSHRQAITARVQRPGGRGDLVMEYTYGRRISPDKGFLNVPDALRVARLIDEAEKKLNCP